MSFKFATMKQVLKYKGLLLLLLVCNIGIAQEKLTLDELKFSINYSQPTRHIKLDSKPGAGLGVYHKFRKDKTTNFLIGIEYNYTHYTNASVTVENSIYNPVKKEKLEINFHSVTFPLTFKINASKLFYTKLGLLFDFNILTKEQGTIYNSKEQSDYSKQKSYFRPTIGLDFGVGVNFSKLFFASIGYSYFINNNDIYQRVPLFNLSLGIKFKS